LPQNKKVQFQKSENLFEDAENKYVESSNRLFDTVIQSLDYFKKINDFSLKNDDKILKIKNLKDNYDKLSQDYELILKENQKLKEKNKILKDKSQNSNLQAEFNTSCSSTSAVNNVSLNKFIDSLMYLQTKNEDLEKENKSLKIQVESLKEKVKYEKKKRLPDEKLSSNRTKLINTKSQNTLHSQKNKNDQMELLLKEQISCMQKMLVIVQDSKDSTGNTNSSVSVTIF
jgi:DNA recombination protein RmuC